MDTKDIRLERLRLIIKNKFDGLAGQCADALEMKRPQVSRWVTKNEKSRQGISDESARLIEKKLGYPRGWLDGMCALTDLETGNNKTKQPAVNEPEPSIYARIAPKKTRHDEQIDKIMRLLFETDLEGLSVVLREAERMAEQYPRTKQNASIIVMKEWR